MRFGTRAVYMSTRQAVDKTVFRFLRTFLVRKYLAIETKYFAAKKTHTHPSTARQGLVEHVCKRLGYISEKHRGRFDVCAKYMRHLQSYVVVT